MAFNSKCEKCLMQNLELDMTFISPDVNPAFFLKFAWNVSGACSVQEPIGFKDRASLPCCIIPNLPVLAGAGPSIEWMLSNTRWYLITFSSKNINNEISKNIGQVGICRQPNMGKACHIFSTAVPCVITGITVISLDFWTYRWRRTSVFSW